MLTVDAEQKYFKRKTLLLFRLETKLENLKSKDFANFSLKRETGRFEAKNFDISSLRREAGKYEEKMKLTEAKQSKRSLPFYSLHMKQKIGSGKKHAVFFLFSISTWHY